VALGLQDSPELDKKDIEDMYKDLLVVNRQGVYDLQLKIALTLKMRRIRYAI
jgi:hypothetical protein